MTIPYKKIYAYCKTQIDDFAEKEQIALHNLDKWRCPLEHAFPSFFDEMRDAIDDWVSDNDFNENALEYDIMVEDVFWKGAE